MPGKVPYVVAHSIAVKNRLMPFERAYVLALIVFEHDGGPVSPAPKKNLRKPLLDALTKSGYLDKIGGSTFERERLTRYDVLNSRIEYFPPQVGFDLPIRELSAYSQKVQWQYIVTESGAALVNDHLPQ